MLTILTLGVASVLAAAIFSYIDDQDVQALHAHRI